jgi:hypothetical protein
MYLCVCTYVLHDCSTTRGGARCSTRRAEYIYVYNIHVCVYLSMYYMIHVCICIWYTCICIYIIYKHMYLCVCTYVLLRPNYSVLTL